MANLLERYGIKEVADVTFYEIDSKGAPSAPVLYLDTLKVSTIEQSAESTDATGGKGNPPLISWDYGKEINVTLEDALFSAKSLAVMFGGIVDKNDTRQEVLKTLPADKFTAGDHTIYTTIGPNQTVYIPDSKAIGYVYSGDASKGDVISDGALVTHTNFNTFQFITFDLLDTITSDKESPAAGDAQAVTGIEIEISAEQFPGTYYVTGDTYARSALTGRDEFFQFVIPRAKVQPTDLSLTMEAEGDPSTFSMTLKVLRTDDGQMMKLIKYNLESSETANKNKGTGSLVNSDYHLTYSATAADSDYTAGWGNKGETIASKQTSGTTPEN